MNAEKFRVAAGISAQHVPFRGTPEAITETMTGRTDWLFAPMVSALPLIKDGRLKALAVGTATRSSALLQRAVDRRGRLPECRLRVLGRHVFAPAKTPRPVVERLHDEVVKVLAQPDVRDRLDKLGAVPFTMAQPAFEKYLDDETIAAAALVRAAGIKLE